MESAKDHQLNKPKFTGCTLPATKMAPENGWLEYDPVLLEPGLFSEAMMLVSGSPGNFSDVFVSCDHPVLQQFFPVSKCLVSTI